MSADTEALACTYASLILHEEEIEISAEKIQAVLKAAGVSVEPYWPSLFSQVLAKKSVDDLILSVGSAPAAGGAAAPAGGAAAAAAEETKEEEPEEEEEEDMGFDLFD